MCAQEARKQVLWRDKFRLALLKFDQRWLDTTNDKVETRTRFRMVYRGKIVCWQKEENFFEKPVCFLFDLLATPHRTALHRRHRDRDRCCNTCSFTMRRASFVCVYLKFAMLISRMPLLTKQPTKPLMLRIANGNSNGNSNGNGNGPWRITIRVYDKYLPNTVCSTPHIFVYSALCIQYMHSTKR